MSVSNETIMLVTSLALNYLILHRRLPFAAHLVCVIIGVTTWWIDPNQPFGFIITTIGMIMIFSNIDKKDITNLWSTRKSS